MKIMTVEVQNFGSYKNLSFEFDDLGLTLISGPTGSGKSTLCDIVPWVLYGITAKNGSANDIVSWGVSETTYGHVILDMGSYSLWIARTRNPNDLYYVIDGVWEHPKRGKDLNDTQKLINELLGMDADTYLSAAYFHEFSQTSNFFTASARNRRTITEELVDLSLAVKIKTNLTEYTKGLKEELGVIDKQLILKENSLSNLEKQIQQESAKKDQWYDKQAKQIDNLHSKVTNFESSKQKTLESLNTNRAEFEQEKDYETSKIINQIQQLGTKLKPDSYFLEQREILASRKVDLGDTKCKECGAQKNSHKYLLIERDIHSLDKQESENNRLRVDIVSLNNQLIRTKARANPYEEQIKRETASENMWLQQLELIKLEENPHEVTLKELGTESAQLRKEAKSLRDDILESRLQLSDASLLSDVLEDFRSCLISQTIGFLESNTNNLLIKYFDAEIRVKFEVQDSDKLDVLIYKDGNEANFTQLSKGQRQLLKLCFGVSVMKQVSNNSGVDVNCVFMDEVTSGLDEQMKLKVFDLLQSLEKTYASIFLVEHSEALKSCFNKRFNVRLIDGASIIDEES
jgi:exonuclease SbcC